MIERVGLFVMNFGFVFRIPPVYRLGVKIANYGIGAAG